MTWNGPADFFAMGGYGLYVWGAYAVTAASLSFDAISAVRRHRHALAAHDDDEHGGDVATAEPRDGVAA